MSENNLDNNKSGNKIATYVAATLLAGLVGFLAIYVTFAPKDNKEANIAQKNTNQASATPLKKLDCPRKPGSLKPNLTELHRFNCGNMVSFLINKNKPIVKNIEFNNRSGETIDLHKWRGKFVLLNVWATWCSPCRKEMPDLDELKHSFKDKNFDVLAINIDRGGLAKPKRFLEKAGIKHLKLFNDAKSNLIGPLRVIGMPTTLLIDPAGREIGRLVGPADWASDDAKAFILQAMK